MDVVWTEIPSHFLCVRVRKKMQVILEAVWQICVELRTYDERKIVKCKRLTKIVDFAEAINPI